MSLNGKVCVVTGGGSGIGQAVAVQLASEGATVVTVGRTFQKVEDVSNQIKKDGGQSTPFSVDVSEAEEVNSMVNGVLKDFGRIDILVNSAGGGVLHKRLLTTTPDDIRRCMGSNLEGTIYCTQAVLPSMIEQGEGLIINISSGAAKGSSFLGGMIYGVAKAGVNSFTDFINFEFANTGVRATILMPGEVDTPALSNNRPIPPSQQALDTMLKAPDVADAVSMIANLPPRAQVPEISIRPAHRRDTSAETPSS
jgi:NADP-dependent 3-hydroxy acid dehydrogenase YdfG